MEEKKIECAQKNSDEINEKNKKVDNVKYDVVTDYEKLMSVVQSA